MYRYSYLYYWIQEVYVRIHILLGWIKEYVYTYIYSLSWIQHRGSKRYLTADNQELAIWFVKLQDVWSKSKFYLAPNRFYGLNLEKVTASEAKIQREKLDYFWQTYVGYRCRPNITPFFSFGFCLWWTSLQTQKKKNKIK